MQSGGSAITGTNYEGRALGASTDNRVALRFQHLSERRSTDTDVLSFPRNSQAPHYSNE
jgi:hypothetical protein